MNLWPAVHDGTTGWCLSLLLPWKTSCHSEMNTSICCLHTSTRFESAGAGLLNRLNVVLWDRLNIIQKTRTSCDLDILYTFYTLDLIFFPVSTSGSSTMPSGSVGATLRSSFQLDEDAFIQGFPLMSYEHCDGWKLWSGHGSLHVYICMYVCI